MLNTEDDSAAMGSRIEAAAKAQLGIDDLEVHYEHGQWWVLAYDDEDDQTRTWSAIDAVGAGTCDGFAFEEVG